MKNLINIFASVILLSAPSLSSSASFTQDIGKIQKIFVTTTGDIAIALTGGFPNAIADNQCPGANNIYAGVTASVDPAFKSALLAAKAAQQTVTVTIIGCLGTWFKIVDVYIE